MLLAWKCIILSIDTLYYVVYARHLTFLFLFLSGLKSTVEMRIPPLIVLVIQVLHYTMIQQSFIIFIRLTQDTHPK